MANLIAKKLMKVTAGTTVELTYLRAGAALNPRLRPVYHTVALADNDTDDPELNNLCMGAAFLRSAFFCGKGYDFNIQALRDSLVIDQQMSAFHAVCDTLEEFRREAGRPIDIYAAYRNQD